MEPRNLYALLLRGKNLTTNALAEKLGGKVEQSQLNRFETGKTREPRRSTLQPVADYFGVPVEVFYSADLAAMTAAKLDQGMTPAEIFPDRPQPIPEAYAALTKENPEGITLTPRGTAKVIRPLPFDDAARDKLMRFLRALQQVPEHKRVEALKAATEVLLDHLPPVSTDGLGLPPDLR